MKILKYAGFFCLISYYVPVSAQTPGDQTFLLKGKCVATSSITKNTSSVSSPFECDSAVYTENVDKGEGFVQFLSSTSPDDPPFAFAGDLASGQVNVARVYMRKSKASIAEKGVCFINYVTNGQIKTITCGAKVSEDGSIIKATVGFEVISQKDISEGVKSVTSTSSGQSATGGSNSIHLTCSGYSKLVHTNQIYNFNISEAENKFSGTMNSLRNISGEVTINGSVLILTFQDRTKMQYTVWIDRSNGSFKLDRSNDKLYLPDDVTGSCVKNTGNAF